MAAGVYNAETSGSASPDHPLIRNFSADDGGVYDHPLTATDTPTPAPAAQEVGAALPPGAPPPLRDRPFELIIDKIGVDAPVVTYGLDANDVPEVPYDAQDVAWYNFSAQPGTGGNAVFAGHVTWSGRAVFYYLDQLSPGDNVTLRGTDGTTLNYTISDVFLVDPQDPNSVSVMGPSSTDEITIITCGGQPYYVGGFFRYDYTRRLVVRGRLASVNVVAQVQPEPAGG